MRNTRERDYLYELRQLLSIRFNDEELRTLCFDLAVDYDSLQGEGKAGKVRELVAYFERRDCVPELIEVGKRLRPDISWGNFSKVVKESSSGWIPKETNLSTSGDASHEGAEHPLPTLVHRAEQNRIARRYDDAIRDATEALRIEPRNASALSIRAAAYLDLGRYDDVIRDATEAVHVEPHNAFALRSRSMALRCLGRYDDAIRDATEAAHSAPGDVYTLLARAAAYLGLGQYNDAIRDATEALHIEPNNAYALSTRATAYLDLSRYNDAIRDATEALHIEPNNAYALRVRAEAYQLRDR